MVDIYSDDTNAPVGSIADSDLQVLIDALEEESTRGERR